MKRVSQLAAAVLLMLPAFLGCSFTHLYGKTMQGVELDARQHLHVVRGTDKQDIATLIANRLERAGFNAIAGDGSGDATAEADVVVSYEDHWQWDMSMYLIVLRIDFRDPETEELLASGQSYRTSLDRKSPEFMVDEIIATMFVGR